LGVGDSGLGAGDRNLELGAGGGTCLTSNQAAMQTHTPRAEWWPWLRAVHTELHIKNEQWEWAVGGGEREERGGSGSCGFRGERAVDSRRAMSFSVAEQGWPGLRRRYQRRCTDKNILIEKNRNDIL